MPVYVPKGFSQTDDFFAGVMVDAPEFAMNGMSVADAFSRLRAGIDSVLACVSDHDWHLALGPRRPFVVQGLAACARYKRLIS